MGEILELVIEACNASGIEVQKEEISERKCLEGESDKKFETHPATFEKMMYGVHKDILWMTLDE